MARKTPKKKQKLQRQYKEQIKRIEKNYRSIESQGGSFSVTVDEIIKPVKNPKESTIRRLKSISKDDLYRLAKTETGESGWKLRLERDRRSASRASHTRLKTKIAKEKYGQYYDTYTEEDKKLAREEAYEEWRWEHFRDEMLYGESRKEAERYEEPEIIPPEIEEPEPTEPDYNPYTGTGTEQYYEPDFDLSDTEDGEKYADQIYDNITDLINQNQDSTFMQGIKTAFDNMTNGMSPHQLNKWIDENGEDFYEAIEEVLQYTPQYGGTGEGLNKFTEAITMINRGITPLDSYDNPMVSGGGGSGMYRSSSDYYNETNYRNNKYDTDAIYAVNRSTGEIIEVHQESYIQRVNKWGQPVYETKWFDENGMTVDFGGAYVPLSEVEEDDDYYR